MAERNENKAKKKSQRDEIDESERSSLEEEMITTLKEKNEEIKSGKVSDNENESSKKGNKSGGFDEWSVSWP